MLLLALVGEAKDGARKKGEGARGGVTTAVVDRPDDAAEAAVEVAAVALETGGGGERGGEAQGDGRLGTGRSRQPERRRREGNRRGTLDELAP